MEKIIYLDNAATTKMNKRVLDAMLPFLQEYYGNPAGIYDLGQKSKNAVEKARGQVANALGCSENEIFFTGGGTESDNWVLKKMAESKKTPHIITTRIEHHAILNTCRDLEKKGAKVTYLDVDEYGVVQTESLERAIEKDTVLITVMTANNEIGSIQPIEKIGTIAKKHGILFHTDAVQAFGHIPIDLKKWNIDFLSASAHKFHGPKGCGFLYVREGIELPSFLHGGAQEREKRAGTLNVPGIVGMGEAAQWAAETLTERNEKEQELRQYLIRSVEARIPYTRLNGHPVNRLSNNANFSFQFVEGETLLIILDMNGICASAASACSAGSTEISYVLKAIGLPTELARGTLRLTISAETTKEDIDRTVGILEENVKKLREMSKTYTEYVKLSQGRLNKEYGIGKY